MTSDDTAHIDRTLLDDHVSSFNHGVRSGDFGPMVARFTPEATLEFEGVPIGPFTGREAIAGAYADNPPDDEMEIIEATGTGDTIEAVYAWRADHGTPAGRMVLGVTPDQRIDRLVVTFEPFDGANGGDGATA
jgi:hypothetical protein